MLFFFDRNAFQCDKNNACNIVIFQTCLSFRAFHLSPLLSARDPTELPLPWLWLWVHRAGSCCLRVGIDLLVLVLGWSVGC